MPPSSSRSLREAAPAVIEADSCECKSTPRPCIFFHGLGNPNEELQDTPKLTKHKFGDISGHAPCCTTTKYAVLNTVDYGWTNDTLQQKFCDFSLSMSDTSDQLSHLCNDEYTGMVTGLLELIGQCPASAARKSISYENEKFSTPELNAGYAVAREAYRSNVTAALCSTYYGVLAKFSPSSTVGGKVIPHKLKENDGLVEFQSCLGGLDPSLFGNNYLERFYAAKLNHADSAFLTHDGFFKDSQKPFNWFECLCSQEKFVT
ncbi:unnamed protein product [Phytophthora lilii]|uniref:Unnamed protein product n=1 Tax=Phytophthora lilii TaxID=2077276 RepID=A0A9W7CMJ9_9STRA|nr:unnamed protein product [Phytophthora lilii]